MGFRTSRLPPAEGCSPHGDALAGTISGTGHCRPSERRCPAWTHPVDHGRSHGHPDCEDHAKHSSQRHALVHAHHGPRDGLSQGQCARIWRANGLKPHRVESFKVSNDPDFADKLEDIVGLYLNPPEHALVLSVDEKSQIQALDRTQPGLPMKKGRGATMTHDYKRNGTTTLFAALNTANGEVYRPVSGATPPSGVAEVPAHDRSDRAGRQSKSTSSATTTRPTNMNGSNAGWHATNASMCTSRPPRPHG